MTNPAVLNLTPDEIGWFLALIVAAGVIAIVIWLSTRWHSR